mmetsp:Transcript_56176/g.99294  ORF Transcript_56176/g.99294 Transcript_56176/m.99294 type:complete len:95 (+) Transcript_56176:587-871(+)
MCTMYCIDQKYNYLFLPMQLIFESAAYLEQLPRSIEAMFYLTTNCKVDIFDGPKCKDYVQKAHKRFLQHFNLTQNEIPLLKLDLWNWDAPFSLE